MKKRLFATRNRTVYEQDCSIGRICRRGGLTSLLLLLLMGLIRPIFLGPVMARAADPGWQDTGLNIPISVVLDPNKPRPCFDNTEPSVLLVSVDEGNSSERGTFAYNWRTGQRGKVNDIPFQVCNEATGLLYGYSPTSPVRFSRKNNLPQPIRYLPTALANDGVPQLYHLEPGSAEENNKLFSSSDGGTTWEERGQQFNGGIAQLAVVSSYAEAIYALVRQTPSSETVITYGLYFSVDGGKTWQKRSERKLNYASIKLTIPNVSTATINELMLTTSTQSSHTGYSSITELSRDGGLSFIEAGSSSQPVRGEGSFSRFFLSERGSLSLSSSSGISKAGSISVDNDKSHQSWKLPFSPVVKEHKDGLGIVRQYNCVDLSQVATAPDSFLLLDCNSSEAKSWFSTDGGQNWSVLPVKFDGSTSEYTSGGGYAVFTPYAPRTLLAFNKDGRLFTLDLSRLDGSLRGKVNHNFVPDNTYFEQTGHNLPGAFKNYWEQHGGLAQFGYPITDPFNEINPSDGKIYSVQYFERNRFEYHRENAGTQYEVLLGLLGNQLTEARRTQNEAPFGRISDPKVSNQLYFDATGHTLKARFREYWQAHGGLALYGYPISEQFEEKNPDDGQTYSVQYFERNRFELHPENTGTQYEVLLGLLGNTLLGQKGWLAR